MNFLKKLGQTSLATASIVAVVCLLLAFGVVEFRAEVFVPFFIGAIFLIFGQTGFLVGIDYSILEIGKDIGNHLSKKKSVWLPILFGFVFGFVTTIAEPDVQVLVGQFTGTNAFLSTWLLLSIFGVGAGLFFSFALFRIFKKIPLKYCLLAIYGLIFVLAAFAPSEYLGMSFDAGGVSTGLVTVPFLLSLAIGICSVRGGASKEDNFGAVAIVSTGPIIATLVLGLILGPTEVTGSASSEVLALGESLLSNMQDVAIALAPLIVLFVIMQFTMLKLPAREFFRILVGFVISFVGMVLFMTGVFYGFSPMGQYVGESLQGFGNWLAILVGLILGFLIVFTEPSIMVLSEQVEDVTSKLLRKKVIYVVLGIGIAISVVFGFLHILFNISLWWFFGVLYFLCILLSFFIDPIFVSIAFDSGGIASGTMTVAFLLPIFMGLGGEALNAFGISGLVATVPILTVEILGLVYKIMSNRARRKKSGK